MLKYGQIIKQSRMNRGLSLQQLADKADTYKGYISGIENGSLNPPSAKLTKKLCHALNLNFQNLLAMGWFEKRPKQLTLSSIRKFVVEASLREAFIGK